MTTLLLMLLNIVSILLSVFTFIIVVQAILSWLILFNVINTYNEFVGSLWHGLQALTEPVYRPIRRWLHRLLPDLGALDLSPLVVLLLLYILSHVVLPTLATSVALGGIGYE